MHDRQPHALPTGNLLLDALSADERSRVLAGSRSRSFDVGSVLFRAGDAVDYVAFPTHGTLSLLAQPDEGPAVEAATVGREGAASLHSAFGSRRAAQELVGQVDGDMITIETEAFVKVAQQGEFQALVYGYLEALRVQISLS